MTVNYEKVKIINKNIIIKKVEQEIKTETGLLIKSDNSNFILKGVIINFDTKLNLTKNSLAFFKKGKEKQIENDYFIINEEDILFISCN